MVSPLLLFSVLIMLLQNDKRQHESRGPWREVWRKIRVKEKSINTQQGDGAYSFAYITVENATSLRNYFYYVSMNTM